MNSQCIHLRKALTTILSQDNETSFTKKNIYIYTHIQNHSRRCVQFEFTRDNLSI